MFPRPSRKCVSSTAWISAFFALLCLALSGCSPYGKADAELVGTWWAGTAQEVSAKYTFRADGSYESKISPTGQYGEGSAASTTGKWGVKGGILRLGMSQQVVSEYEYKLEGDKSPKVLRLKMISMVNVGNRQLQPVKQAAQRFEKLE